MKGNVRGGGCSYCEERHAAARDLGVYEKDGRERNVVTLEEITNIDDMIEMG